jgi:hypothetical protein
MLFISSGGLGDALIVGLKIQQWRKNNAKLYQKKAQWFHYEKHECHREPIEQIIPYFVNDGGCVISKSPEKDALRTVEVSLSMGRKSIYLHTKLNVLSNPYIDFPIESVYIPYKNFNKKHICIQTAAGRLHDSTKRMVSKKVIEDMSKLFPDKAIVLIGTEKIDDYKGTKIRIFSGKLDNIVDTFKLIDGCCLFIGLDGVLAYYAAMKKKPCIIHYHIPTLLNHYYNEKWNSHVLPLCGTHNLGIIPNNSQYKKVIGLVT